ncbi:hypothetical protein, partial [Candidatus Binatus sp.]|uniref:hypothetical protein n=1 Tax=Candidatus Binatus sp. TaxID=2811406 RepID=UPI003C46E945
LGAVNRLLGVLGAGGVALSLLAAAGSAASAPIPREHSGPLARVYLWIVNLIGPALRGLARERVKWRFEPAEAGADPNGPVELHDQIEFRTSAGAALIDSATLLVAIRDALVRRGLAVAETDGFQSYDLQVVVPPMIRVPINALRTDAGIAVLWRTRAAPQHALVAAAVMFVLLAAGFSLGAGIVGMVFAALAVGLLAITRARRIPAIINACAPEVAGALGISVGKRQEDET